MTTEAPALNGSPRMNAGLKRYAEALSYPRRHMQRVLGADVDPDFCLTDFMFCIGTNNHKRLKSVYQAERTKSSMGQTSGPSGGYLVPTELSLDIMADVSEAALIRPRAQVVPMNSSRMLLPLPDATTAQTAATAPFFGGILMTWTQEQQTRPETEPAFRQVELKAWDLTGYALESNPMAADAGPGLEAWFRKIFAQSIAWYEDRAYLFADGVGKPTGILNNAGTKVVTRQTSVQFTQQDVYKMSQALLPDSWGRAIWIVSPSIWEWLMKMGTTQWQINQPMDVTEGKPHFVLNGQHGFVSSQCPTVGTTGDVILVDPGLYVIGDRGAVEIAVSLHEPTAFLKNQLVWRVTYRGDGQPWFNKLLTMADASTTVSPYVVLSTL